MTLPSSTTRTESTACLDDSDGSPVMVSPIHMTCHELAKRLEALRPELSATDVARLCLLILGQCDDLDSLADDQALLAAWNHASFRLEAASDQHDAVAAELDQMCNEGPIQFSPDQLWTLLRAVKVQSQILELYTEQPALA